MPFADFSLLKRLSRNKRGAAAVEFAMIMVPLVALILVSLQTAIIYFEGQALQTATEKAGRALMTGSVQLAGTSKSAFASQVCGYATTFNCSNLMVDVESGSSFSAISTSALTPTYSSPGTPTKGWGSYSPGNPGDIVIVRLMYDWPIFGGKLVSSLSNQPNNGFLLVGTTVFKNEPYE